MRSQEFHNEQVEPVNKTESAKENKRNTQPTHNQ